MQPMRHQQLDKQGRWGLVTASLLRLTLLSHQQDEIG